MGQMRQAAPDPAGRDLSYGSNSHPARPFLYSLSLMKDQYRHLSPHLEFHGKQSSLFRRESRNYENIGPEKNPQFPIARPRAAIACGVNCSIVTPGKSPHKFST